MVLSSRGNVSWYEVRRIKQARPCECPFAEIRGALLPEAQPRKPPTKPAAAGLKMRVPFMRTSMQNPTDISLDLPKANRLVDLVVSPLYQPCFFFVF